MTPLQIITSFGGRLDRICLGTLKLLLFFCSSAFPQVSDGELQSVAPLCGGKENRGITVAAPRSCKGCCKPRSNCSSHPRAVWNDSESRTDA